MTLPQKGRRKIEVKQEMYHWIASGNDGYILLILERTQLPMLKVVVQVDYYEHDTGAPRQSRSTQTTIISPSLVRRTIEYALSCGWGTTFCHDMYFAYQKGVFTQRMPF